MITLWSIRFCENSVNGAVYLLKGDRHFLKGTRPPLKKDRARKLGSVLFYLFILSPAQDTLRRTAQP